MATDKTELEFPYSPPDFFEVPYHRKTDEYVLIADAGVVRVTLCAPSDPIDAELENQITKEVEGLFLPRQLQTHRSFAIESARVQQYHADGTSLILKGVGGTLKLSGGPLDFIMSDASGAVVQDTKFERIAAHTKFIDSVIPKLAGSETLKALLESYNAAVSHPASELVRLFEIREKLSEHHGGDDEMRRRLGISEKHWKRFGSLTNDLPLKERRHCGKHSNLRHATAVELDDARRIARGWIKTFADQL
jgi:hypothetical protein